jgi:hypothetical protein
VSLAKPDKVWQSLETSSEASEDRKRPLESGGYGGTGRGGIMVGTDGRHGVSS